MTFGQRLAALRRSHKLSQYQLADRLGFSRGQLANYEQGQREPDYDTLKKIADFFKVTTDELLGTTELKKSSTQIGDAVYLRVDTEGLSNKKREQMIKEIERLSEIIRGKYASEGDDTKE